jgi:hypothetical protein
MANLMAAEGMTPYLQFGEVQWYFALPGSMPFYDTYTTSTFAALWTPLPVIPSHLTDPAPYLEEAAFRN